MERRPHQGRFDDLAAVDRSSQLLAHESREPGPQRDVRGWGPLALKAGETLDRLDDADFLALQEELTRQQRTIQLTKGERGNASGH